MTKSTLFLEPAIEAYLKYRGEDLRAAVCLDGLTHVYNRSYLEYLVDQILTKEKRQAAFLILELNNFKRINDIYGHVTGDYYLVRFAGLLKDFFREKGIVGRIGGDEFCVMLEGCGEQKAEGLCRDFLKYIAKKDKRIWSCSVGICFSGDKCNSFMELYDRADRAMYKAMWAHKGVEVYKKSGGGGKKRQVYFTNKSKEFGKISKVLSKKFDK